MAIRKQTLTIANGGTQSGSVKIGDADSVTIYGPAAATGVLTVQTSADEGSTFLDLQTGGSDVVLTVAKALVITDLAADELRIESGSAEVAERTIIVAIQEGGQS